MNALFSFLCGVLGIRLDTLSRKEAAVALMQRDVKFSWPPVVVELAQEPARASPTTSLGEVSSG